MYMKHTVVHRFVVGQPVMKENGECGEKYGPFVTSMEAAKALNIKQVGKVNEVLKGNRKSVQGYTFSYDGEAVYEFTIPRVTNRDVRAKKHTKETLQRNLRENGFNVISIDTVNGTATRVTVACCRLNCENVCERTYKDFMSDFALPLCTVCMCIFQKYEREQHKTKWLFEVRPELEVHYNPEYNDNVLFKEVRKGSKKKIFLSCLDCHYIQTIEDATTPNKYTTLKRNGHFYASFTCTRCNSLSTKFPHIAAEWDEAKNGALPQFISFASNREYWWKCKKGHSWKSSIDARTAFNSRCLRCFLNERESFAGKLMKEVIFELFQNEKVSVEALVPETSFRNDCVVEFRSGQRLVFEMQGSYWHYTERKLMVIGNNVVHKDNEKFRANRATGDLVFLVNEYDLNYGNIEMNKEIMTSVIKHIWQYTLNNKFKVGCDILYNKMKCEYTVKRKKAFYITHFNESNMVSLVEHLNDITLQYVKFQQTYNVY
ncbi:hypothetical protein A6M13_00750 [Caryophanon tenue]|uniref:Treble clef zinc finger domain-containing protein n=2 Tax=Caryophanon tenue TaxID=33978 RepID=A0A1C0YMJ7_9BACL|nr:hypothetical protein A6M13_00750 [Caryophanon tenue]